MILLDVRMPGLDGFETAQLIKERTRTRDIPIVFLTAARDEVSEIARGYGVGAVDYVLKPFDPDLLRSKVAVFAELEASRRALKRSEALLSGAFEAAPIGKTVLDAERRIVRSNPAFARLVGRELGELNGVAVVELCDLEDRPTLSATLEDVTRAGPGSARTAGRRPAAAIERRPGGVGRDGRVRDRDDRVRRAAAAGAVGRSDRPSPRRAGPRRPVARTGRARAGRVGGRAAVEAPGAHDGARGARARRAPAAAGDTAGRAVRGRGGGGTDRRRTRPAAGGARRRRSGALDPARVGRRRRRPAGGRCRS